jgi:hypothetical protein
MLNFSFPYLCNIFILILYLRYHLLAAQDSNLPSPIKRKNIYSLLKMYLSCPTFLHSDTAF